MAEDEDEGEVDETISMDESDETSHPAISDAQGSGDAKKVRRSDPLTCRRRIWEIVKAWHQTVP
jgi:hypothetical protein